MFSGVVMMLVVTVSTICLSHHVKPHPRDTEKCRQLSEEERQSMQIELSKGLHWSFLIAPPFKLMSRKMFSISRKSYSSASAPETQFDRAPVYTCPAEVLPGSKLCPWHYVQQTDNNRIPENIVQAHCTCKHCSQHKPSGLKGDCEEVKIDTLVWKRSENGCKYEKQLEEVTIACACRIKYM